MNIDLKTLRVGDTIVFANGRKGVCSVVYRNGGWFIRWDEYDEKGNKYPWSGSDQWCCYPGREALLGYTDTSGNYIATPDDIVDIIKPPLEELQDEIARLKKQIEDQQPRDRDNVNE